MVVRGRQRWTAGRPSTPDIEGRDSSLHSFISPFLYRPSTALLACRIQFLSACFICARFWPRSCRLYRSPPPPPTIWVDPRPADNDGRCRGYSAWQSLRHHDSSSSAPLRLSSSSSSFSLSHRVRRVRRPAPLDTWISRRRIS